MATPTPVKWHLNEDEYYSIINHIKAQIGFEHAKAWVTSNGLEVIWDENLYGTIVGDKDTINWLKLHI